MTHRRPRPTSCRAPRATAWRVVYRGRCQIREIRFERVGVKKSRSKASAALTDTVALVCAVFINDCFKNKSCGDTLRASVGARAALPTARPKSISISLRTHRRRCRRHRRQPHVCNAVVDVWPQCVASFDPAAADVPDSGTPRARTHREDTSHPDGPRV